jgi:CHAT domain-containing protein
VLMEAFYAKWKSGSPAASALRHAQEHLRTFVKPAGDGASDAGAKPSTTPYANPRYWAGWALWGFGD